MTLTNKEKLVAVISNGIAVFSLLQERDELPKKHHNVWFWLKVIPQDLKSELSVDLVDEVFQYVTSTHSSWYSELRYEYGIFQSSW